MRLDAEETDLSPLPGGRVKQWVVETRRELAWESATCPRVDVASHLDNTGALCRCVGNPLWRDLGNHCSYCGERAAALRLEDPRVSRWIAERARRPPVTADREALSDEIESCLCPLRPGDFVRRSKLAIERHICSRQPSLPRRVVATAERRDRSGHLVVLETLGTNLTTAYAAEYWGLDPRQRPEWRSMSTAEILEECRDSKPRKRSGDGFWWRGKWRMSTPGG